MKRLHLIFVLLTVSLLTYGQNNYEKVSSYGEYQEKWALVEIGGLLGFIDQEGNEIIKTKYEKIINDKKLEGIIKGKKEMIKN
jgi:cytochrome oxidase Cu insertion factor (SCO1/SenC/PrrC family)